MTIVSFELISYVLKSVFVKAQHLLGRFRFFLYNTIVREILFENNNNNTSSRPTMDENQEENAQPPQPANRLDQLVAVMRRELDEDVMALIMDPRNRAWEHVRVDEDDDLDMDGFIPADHDMDLLSSSSSSDADSDTDEDDRMGEVVVAEGREEFDSDFDEYYFSDDSNETLFRDVLKEKPVVRTRRQLRLMCRNQREFKQNTSAYAFQPLRLIRCNYKAMCKVFSFPCARSGHRIVADESHLYCLGGYNPQMNNVESLLFQEMWSFNFANNKWKCVLTASEDTNMPAELASNALIMHNNVVISYGGTGYPFGEQCSNDCHVYTTGAKSLVSRLEVSGELPTAQYGPAIVIHDNYLYTIGGTTGFDYSCDVSRLNLKTKVWENLYNCRPEMREDPEGRYRHEVVYDGHHIFVLGGGTSATVFDLKRLPAFNLKTNKWDFYDTLPDRSVLPVSEEQAGHIDMGYPKARKCFSCVQHKLPNGDVEAFITGGLQSLLQDDFTTYFSDLWKLNLRTKQWTWIRTASLPRPLYFHSAAHNGHGCMYIFGGIAYNSKSMRRRNDLFKMWMTIPKLSEICWEALNYYNVHLQRVGAPKLLQSGVPQRFVDRLQ